MLLTSITEGSIAGGINSGQPPSAKADGFYGHARTIVPRSVRKPQSEAQNITGSVEFQPGDLVLVHSKGFSVLRLITRMYWNHLLIIDEKV